MPAMLWADEKGRIRDHPNLLMLGQSGREVLRPEEAELTPLPDLAKLFYLPDCAPLGFDPRTGQIVRAERVMVGSKWYKAQAVAAFPPPGWVRTLLPAADYSRKSITLPMWSYTAVGFGPEGYLIPAFRIEEHPGWDPNSFDDNELLPKLEQRLKERSGNRLYAHLADCATLNHCFAAKNLFLGRFEAPLPVSRRCNAACLGCLSLQPPDGPTASHHRISFRPWPEEVAQVALDHLSAVPEGIVSFGQGCEGEPLSEAELIEAAIKKIRAGTTRGTVNLNTNGSRPEAVQRLVQAGLDSIRVSLVSPRENIFTRYVRPKGFGLDEVARSLVVARENGLFTMINYLVFPGLSDQEEEIESLLGFLRRTGVQFVHLKNLCLDPDLYLKAVGPPAGRGKGLINLAETLTREVKGLRLGYFNQPATRRPVPPPA